MADIPISNVARRVQFTGNTGTGPFAFSFNILADSDLVVIKNTTTLNLTSDYTVSTSSNGTGSVTLGSALVASDILTIIGGRDLERTTDFVTAGDLLASSLNEQLDSLVIMAQQLDEKVGRAIIVNAGDESVSLEMPTKDNRKGTVLAFNATSGAPEAGPLIGDVASIAAVTADIQTLAHIEDGTDATDAIQTVAGISSNVSTVSGISSNVTTVAGISANVTTVAGNNANVTTVAGISANVTTVAGISSDVTTAAGISSDITSAASTFTTTLVNNIATLTPLSTSIAALGPISSDITAVANDATDIGNVAGSISNINLVASNINSGILTAINDFGSVANATVSTNDYGSL
tara:strand:- start:3080 stop:4129 length:1050 start_codon:yes stop_codon:yes gene_type:complete